MTAYKQLYICLICILLAIGMLVGFTLWQQRLADQRWCSTLQTINASDKGITKAKAVEKKLGTYGYELVQDFRKLQPEFGCGKPPIPKGA